MEAHEQKIQERIERILGPEVDVLLDDCDFMTDFQAKLYEEYKNFFQAKLEQRITVQDIEDRMKVSDVVIPSDADETEPDDSGSDLELISEASEKLESAKGSEISVDLPDSGSEASPKVSPERSSSSSEMFSPGEVSVRYISPKVQALNDTESIEQLYIKAAEAIRYHSTLNRESASQDTKQPTEDEVAQIENQTESEQQDETAQNLEDNEKLKDETTQEEVRSQEEEPVREKVLGQEEAPAQEEVPSQEKEPVRKEVPGQEEEPAQEEVPSQEEEPVRKEVPGPEEEPSQEEEPVREEVPGQEEVPSQEEEPVREEVPGQEEEPAQEEVPSQEEEPTPEEVPSQEEEPTPEEVPSQEEEPTQEDARSLVENGTTSTEEREALENDG